MVYIMVPSLDKYKIHIKMFSEKKSSIAWQEECIASQKEKYQSLTGMV